jgi:hypothetical protein
VVLRGNDVWPTTAAWSPDGRWIALAKGPDVVVLGGDGRAQPRVIEQLPRGSEVDSVAWRPHVTT